LKGFPTAKSNDGKSTRGLLLDQVRAVRDQQRAVEDERRRLIKELGDARESLKKKTGDLAAAKDKIPFKTTNDIDRRIREFENQLESGSFKLIEEKQIIAEISKLRKARKQLESLDGSGSDTASLRIRIESIREKLTLKDAELEKIKAQVTEISTKINEIDGVRAEDYSKRANRQQLITKTKQELDDAYSERKALYEEHKTTKKALYEARIKREARKAEAERCQKIQDQIDVLQEKLLGFNPETIYDKKVHECNNLVAFFMQFTDGEKKSDVQETTSSLAAPVGREAKLSEELAGAEVINKKTKEDDYFIAPSFKKKPSHKTHQSSNQLGKLPIHIMAALGDLNLSIPSTVSQLPDLFTSIQQSKFDLGSKKEEGKDEIMKMHREIEIQIDELKKQLEAKPIKEEKTEIVVAEDSNEIDEVVDAEQ